MSLGMYHHDETHLVLAPEEKHVLEVERDLLPYWVGLAVLGMGFVAYGLYDPIYGWGTFFLGMILMAFIGGAIRSTRYHLTDRRLVRTGYLGVKAVPLRGARVRVERGRTLTVENGDARLRIRFVRDANAVETLALRARGP